MTRVLLHLGLYSFDTLLSNRSLVVLFLEINCKFVTTNWFTICCFNYMLCFSVLMINVHAYASCFPMSYLYMDLVVCNKQMNE